VADAPVWLRRQPGEERIAERERVDYMASWTEVVTDRSDRWLQHRRRMLREHASPGGVEWHTRIRHNHRELAIGMLRDRRAIASPLPLFGCVERAEVVVLRHCRDHARCDDARLVEQVVDHDRFSVRRTDRARQLR